MMHGRIAAMIAVAGMLGFFGTGSIHGQTPPATQVPWANKFFTAQNPPPPVVVHDFGTVPYGTMLSHRFPITNIYAVPMQITEIRKTCGCVNATATTQTLQPRETATIDVTMDARKFTGQRTVTIYVTVGPKFISTALLQVSAFSRADVMLSPGQVNFGVVPQGQAAVQSVEVQYTGQNPFQITGVSANNGPFEVVYQETMRQRGRIVYRVNVTLKADAPSGPISEQIVLQTNDSSSKQVSVQVSGLIQAPLAVSPGTVKFDSVRVGNILTQRVIVRGSGKPFRILKVEGDGDGITVELPPVAMPVQIVNIRFQPGKTGNLSRRLVFQTDLDQGAVASVMVEANGVP
ncbi:DUF1573 domain-containing protein [Tuwongella immobilis]|nr:DUF1573 domain-containing protein [Tuwongella immobilis]